MRLAARLLAPALGAALALGCAGSRPPPPPPKPPLVEAKGALPPDLDLVVRIDLARVRSALGPAVVADLRRAAQASSGLQGTESLLAPLFEHADVLFVGEKTYAGYGSRENARAYLVETLARNLPGYAPPADDRELVFGGWEALCRHFGTPVFFEKSPQILEQWAALAPARSTSEVRR